MRTVLELNYEIISKGCLHTISEKTFRKDRDLIEQLALYGWCGESPKSRRLTKVAAIGILENHWLRRFKR